VRRALARHADALVALLAGPYDAAALDLLRTLAADEDVHIRRAISDALPDVIAVSPEVALELIDTYLLQDRDQFIHERTWGALRALMNAGSERAEELCAELIEIA
jgi:3-methyladenine DNA glycosylase AlkC